MIIFHLFFFFKQKTAYEMRISDWSSDVCSSDLLEADYRARTGIAALKVRHNNVLGYHIEVPARHADALMKPDSGFTHRQTLAGVVRFNAADLHEEIGRAHV